MPDLDLKSIANLSDEEANTMLEQFLSPAQPAIAPQGDVADPLSFDSVFGNSQTEVPLSQSQTPVSDAGKAVAQTLETTGGGFVEGTGNVISETTDIVGSVPGLLDDLVVDVRDNVVPILQEKNLSTEEKFRLLGSVFIDNLSKHIGDGRALQAFASRFALGELGLGVATMLSGGIGTGILLAATGDTLAGFINSKIGLEDPKTLETIAKEFGLSAGAQTIFPAAGFLFRRGKNIANSGLNIAKEVIRKINRGLKDLPIEQVEDVATTTASLLVKLSKNSPKKVDGIVRALESVPELASASSLRRAINIVSDKTDSLLKTINGALNKVAQETDNGELIREIFEPEIRNQKIANFSKVVLNTESRIKLRKQLIQLKKQLFSSLAIVDSKSGRIIFKGTKKFNQRVNSIIAKVREKPQEVQAILGKQKIIASGNIKLAGNVDKIIKKAFEGVREAINKNKLGLQVQRINPAEPNSPTLFDLFEKMVTEQEKFFNGLILDEYDNPVEIVRQVIGSFRSFADNARAAGVFKGGDPSQNIREIGVLVNELLNGEQGLNGGLIRYIDNLKEEVLDDDEVLNALGAIVRDNSVISKQVADLIDLEDALKTINFNIVSERSKAIIGDIGNSQVGSFRIFTRTGGVTVPGTQRLFSGFKQEDIIEALDVRERNILELLRRASSPEQLLKNLPLKPSLTGFMAGLHKALGDNPVVPLIRFISNNFSHINLGLAIKSNLDIPESSLKDIESEDVLTMANVKSLIPSLDVETMTFDPEDRQLVRELAIQHFIRGQINAKTLREAITAAENNKLYMPLLSDGRFAVNIKNDGVGFVLPDTRKTEKVKDGFPERNLPSQ